MLDVVEQLREVPRGFGGADFSHGNQIIRYHSPDSHLIEITTYERDSSVRSGRTTLWS